MKQQVSVHYSPAERSRLCHTASESCRPIRSAVIHIHATSSLHMKTNTLNLITCLRCIVHKPPLLIQRTLKSHQARSIHAEKFMLSNIAPASVQRRSPSILDNAPRTRLRAGSLRRFVVVSDTSGCA